MLDRFTLDTFSPRIGETFRLHLDGQATLDLVLQSAVELPTAGWQPVERAARRPPFTLVFLGPPNVVLPQQIYRRSSPLELGVALYYDWWRSDNGRSFRD